MRRLLLGWLSITIPACASEAGPRSDASDLGAVARFEPGERVRLSTSPGCTVRIAVRSADIERAYALERQRMEATQ
jgi:hypothetical protein